MASEYLRKKYQDVKPDEKRELTPEEKRRNWWDYHKFHVVAVIVLISIIGSIIWNAASQIKPDYQIAYVGASALPDDTAAAIEAGFAALGEDLNGDGRTVVQLMQYTFSEGNDVQMAMASQVKLMADLTECESYFFLLEDPEGFQQNYGSLRKLDGTLPAEDETTGEGTYIGWSECPVLASMELGEYEYPLIRGSVSGSSDELVSKLYIGRRGFWTNKTVPHPEGCEALWEKITEGALLRE